MLELYRQIYLLYLDIVNGRVYAEGLKHGRQYLTVSEIAQQFYCEHKLSLMYREGKVETEDMRLGTYIHEETFRGRSISIDQLLDLLAERERLAFTMPLSTLVDNVPIVGIPDAVLAERGRVVAVIELKTTKRWLDRVFPCEYMQANLYTYILRRWGLATRDCRVIIVKVLREDVDLITRDFLRQVIRKVEKILDYDYSHYSVVLQDRRLAVHSYFYDETTEKNLEWALGYWRGTRPEYIPENKARCRKCEYRHLCRYAQENVSGRDGVELSLTPR